MRNKKRWGTVEKFSGFLVAANLTACVRLAVKMIKVGSTGLACVMYVVITVGSLEAVALKLHTLARNTPAPTGNHVEGSGARCFIKLFHHWNWKRKLGCRFRFVPIKYAFFRKYVTQGIVAVKARLVLAGSQKMHLDSIGGGN